MRCLTPNQKLWQWFNTRASKRPADGAGGGDGDDEDEDEEDGRRCSAAVVEKINNCRETKIRFLKFPEKPPASLHPSRCLTQKNTTEEEEGGGEKGSMEGGEKEGGGEGGRWLWERRGGRKKRKVK